MQPTDVDDTRSVIAELEAELRADAARWRTVRYYLQLAAGLVCFAGSVLLNLIERPMWLAVLCIAWLLALAVIALVALVWWAEHDARAGALREEWAFALRLHHRFVVGGEGR